MWEFSEELGRGGEGVSFLKPLLQHYPLYFHLTLIPPDLTACKTRVWMNYT